MVLIYFVNEYHLGALPSASLEVGFAGLRLRLRLRGMVLIYFVNEYHLGAWPSASLEGDGINLLRK
jgi:hypothetical protein